MIKVWLNDYKGSGFHYREFEDPKAFCDWLGIQTSYKAITVVKLEYSF